MTHFSGSYLADDVEFLIKPIAIDFTDIDEKERRIQSARAHYSEMISREYEPTEAYLDTFYDAHARNKTRFATDVLSLAGALAAKGPIVLISLLRAGTPIGVLLRRTLAEVFDKPVKHYSISIIRDRGIDENALRHILRHHPQAECIFIDGWTGKGVINRELKRFIADFNHRHGTTVSDRLHVVADIAGVADIAATHDDYLIPSSALNSTISGLLSRSILNAAYIGPEDFHGCRYYEEFRDGDLSRWFIDEMMGIIRTLHPRATLGPDAALQSRIHDFLQSIRERYEIHDVNHVKPGIGETTRVLLRRVPDLIMVRDAASPEVSHLLHLAAEKQARVTVDPALPYMALGIIKTVRS